MIKLLAVACTVALLTAGPNGALAQDPSMELWDFYKLGQFEEVVSQGKALLNTGTESGSILLAVGRSLADLERQEEAVFFLKRAVASDKDKTWVYAWAQVYLGKCQFHLGEPALAKDAWVLARDCGATQYATNEAIRHLNTLGLAESYNHWSHSESEHFSCYFSPGLVNVDKADFLEKLEQSHEHINSWFKGSSHHKIRYFLWVDEEESTLAGIPHLGFSLPDEFVCHAGVGQAVEHELARVILHHAVDPVLTSGLISNGTAGFFETGKDGWLQLAREARATQAKKRGMAGPVPLSVMSLWLDWESQTEAVAQPLAAAFVVTLIQQGGKDRYLEALRDQSPTHFREIYGDVLDVWIKSFEAELNR
jgi:tetratricopeptide (TPR) repeat protein